jgi:hypothetical protein
VNIDLTDWLAELVHQQKHRDPRISDVELYRSFDRFFDTLADRQGETTMITHPAGEPLHIALVTGEIVTITTAADRVLVALYAAKPDTGSAGDDDEVEPAPVIALTADECETLGSLLTLAAVNVYGQRRRLRAVDDEGADP